MHLSRDGARLSASAAVYRVGTTLMAGPHELLSFMRSWRASARTARPAPLSTPDGAPRRRRSPWIIHRPFPWLLIDAPITGTLCYWCTAGVLFYWVYRVERCRSRCLDFYTSSLLCTRLLHCIFLIYFLWAADVMGSFGLYFSFNQIRGLAPELY